MRKRKRKPKSILTTLLAMLVSPATTGCLPVADTGVPPAEETAVPTAEAPQNPYSHDDYAAALRSASVKLRGRLPSQEDTSLVRTQGRTAYESLIDSYVDSDAFIHEMHALVSRSLGMGDDTADAGGVLVNTDAPADLASYVIDTDKPWTEILTAEYCITSMIDSGGAMVFAQTPCTNGTPPLERAGILTLHSFLYVYGQANTFNFQRTSVAQQFLNCGIYPVSDAPLVRSNSTPGQDPATDDADPPRVHVKYQGEMMNDDGTTIACAACHSALLSRRNAFTRFDRNGFYDPLRTVADVEDPAENEGKCYVVPDGFALDDLTPCNSVGSLAEALAQPGGCCFDPMFTDPNAADNLMCGEPDGCMGWYAGETFHGTRELAQLILDEELTDSAFYKCQTRRFVDYVIGDNTGAISVSAGVGDSPGVVDPNVIEKYRSFFAREGWNVRELMRALFKGDEFLKSQQD